MSWLLWLPVFIGLVSLVVVLAYETYILRALSRRIEASALQMEARIMERIATGAWDKPVGDMMIRVGDRGFGQAVRSTIREVFHGEP